MKIPQNYTLIQEMGNRNTNGYKEKGDQIS